MKRDVVILACAVSAGVHAALAPAHGTSFVAATALLAAVAIWLTLRPASTIAPAGAACLLVGLLGAYALAVASGEPVDGLALGTKAVEAIGLVAALPNPKGAHRWTRDGQSLSV